MDSYALIIIPQKNILDFVDSYRKRYAKYTSYIIPPHITIYPPFYIKTSFNERGIIELLKKNYSVFRPKITFLESIDYFTGNNNVAFFKPDRGSSLFIKDLLIKAVDSLKDKIIKVYDDTSDYNFTPERFKPHMTIAEKVPDEVFPKLKEEIGRFVERLSFKISSVFLYKQREDSKIWKKLREIKFGKG